MEYAGTGSFWSEVDTSAPVVEAPAAANVRSDPSSMPLNDLLASSSVTFIDVISHPQLLEDIRYGNHALETYLFSKSSLDKMRREFAPESSETNDQNAALSQKTVPFRICEAIVGSSFSMSGKSWHSRCLQSFFELMPRMAESDSFTLTGLYLRALSTLLKVDEVVAVEVLERSLEKQCVIRSIRKLMGRNCIAGDLVRTLAVGILDRNSEARDSPRSGAWDSDGTQSQCVPRASVAWTVSDILSCCWPEDIDRPEAETCASNSMRPSLSTRNYNLCIYELFAALHPGIQPSEGMSPRGRTSKELFDEIPRIITLMAFLTVSIERICDRTATQPHSAATLGTLNDNFAGQLDFCARVILLVFGAREQSELIFGSKNALSFSPYTSLASILSRISCASTRGLEGHTVPLEKTHLNMMSESSEKLLKSLDKLLMSLEDHVKFAGGAKCTGSERIPCLESLISMCHLISVLSLVVLGVGRLNDSDLSESVKSTSGVYASCLNRLVMLAVNQLKSRDLFVNAVVVALICSVSADPGIVDSLFAKHPAWETNNDVPYQIRVFIQSSKGISVFGSPASISAPVVSSSWDDPLPSQLYPSTACHSQDVARSQDTARSQDAAHPLSLSHDSVIIDEVELSDREERSHDVTRKDSATKNKDDDPW